MASIIGRIIKGAVAGLVGTMAMDAVQYRRYRAGGGDSGPLEWEFSTGSSSFDDASAPAEVGQRATDAVAVELPDGTAGATTNVVHWLTGAGYGAVHAIVQGGRPLPIGGLLTGMGAFLNSYATLGALGIYQPIWEYDSDTLKKDLTAHLAFGMTTAVVYALLRGGDD